MALNRAWYNALVDDDGTNTIGTVWGKDDIKNLLDSVDAEIARLDAHPYCEIYLVNGNGQGIPNNTPTVLLYDTPIHNLFGMWSGSDPGSILIPTTGIYHVIGQVFWDFNSVGARSLTIQRDGAVVSQDVLSDGNVSTYTTQTVVGMIHCVAGQKLRLAAFQMAGGTLRAGGFGGPYSTNRIRVDHIY